MFHSKLIILCIAIYAQFLTFELIANGQEIGVKDNFLIKGDLDLKTSDSITKKIKELKEKNLQIRSEIYRLQDELISLHKDNVNLNISLCLDNKENKTQYGVLQLTGLMNNIPIIRYDHPLIFQQDELYTLFQGAIPQGKYEFKLNAIVGQQLGEWPFVLPEGKWGLNKIIEINALKSQKSQNIKISIKGDISTGIPEFYVESEDIKE